MHLLPSEKEKRVTNAISEFKETGELSIYEPCDCGRYILHNNGGNYHDEIYLRWDVGKAFVKYETSCELVAPAEWQECDDYTEVINQAADWLQIKEKAT